VSGDEGPARGAADRADGAKRRYTLPAKL